MTRKGKVLLTTLALLALLGFTFQGWAVEYSVGGRPLEIMGFMAQTVNFGTSGDSHYETMSGFNSFRTEALLEGKYAPNDHLSFFLSGKFDGDWAYQILSSSNEWDKKNFDKSKSRLNILDDWQDLTREAHVTWASDKFYLRAGKQIVQWGETDGPPLTNIINPMDFRRGLLSSTRLGGIKEEPTFIPIWLLRGEYNTPVETSWFKEFGLQFIFDPNFKFRGNDNFNAGNDYMGAWAPIAEAELGGPYPFDRMYIGGLNIDYDKLNDFDPKGFTYALKLKGNIMDTIVSLLFYYGRDRDAVYTDKPSIATMDMANDWDGRMVYYPGQQGYYPYFKFVGATLTRDLSSLKSSFLGGVSPVLRMETLYAFNSSYAVMDLATNATTKVAKTDEFRGLIGFDWKVKIPFLNAKSFFTVSPQYWYQKVMDYPHGDVRLVGRGSMAPNRYETSNHQTSLMINTNYYHTKVVPLFFWYRDWTNRGDTYKLQVSYEPTSNWVYTLGGLMATGAAEDWGPGSLKHKDQLYFTMAYKF